ncbi:E3 ubiquitin-protein ligase MPSR1 [Capsicum galapagoense]
MASESSLTESLMSSSNREGLSLFLPFILAITNARISPSSIQDSSNPEEETRGSTTPSDQFSDRIILVNPVSQGMIVMEMGASSPTFDSIVSELIKEGQPPASKASIEELPTVDVREEDEKDECVVCLDEMGVGEVVKEMPCKHRFHGDCVVTWLKSHGSCPICRYKMPEEESDLNDEKENGRRRREIWMSFSVGSERRSASSSSENDQHVAPEA